MNWLKKQSKTTLALVAIFFIGLGLILYPSVSNYWNSRTSTRVIIDYESSVAAMDTDEVEKELERAREYNEQLRMLSFPLVEYDKVEGYEELLDITGTGVMGYVYIPRIGVNLPIYHGMSEAVLSQASGHLQGSSLPVGGTGTHTVIAAHRGLPSSDLFSRLDKLSEGDLFVLTVMGERLGYEVDQIRIVLPEEFNDLLIDKNEDYATLLTCTPYGVNSHRLLVRGHRVELTDEVILSNEAYELDSTLFAPLVAVPLLLIIFVYIIAKGNRQKKHPKNLSDDDRS